jgi:hypothetical protein
MGLIARFSPDKIAKNKKTAGHSCTAVPGRQHNCQPWLSLIPTLNGNTVRGFSTHGHLSAAQGSLTTVSRSDIRLTQHFDSSARGLVRRWL